MVKTLALAVVLVALLAAGGQVGGDADLLTLINAYRAQNGLGALSVEPRLAASAQWKAQDMETLTGLSHTDSLGRDPFERMTAFGYGDPLAYSRGEVLAFAVGGPRQALEGFQASPSHNAALLKPYYEVAGVGQAGDYYVVNMGRYWLELEPVPVSVVPVSVVPVPVGFPVTLPRTGGR